MEESVRFKPTAGGSFNPLSMYPIGSIYRSVNSTDPSELFGGTWQMLRDVFLMAAGDSYPAGSTGGEAEHALTVDEMPNHTHMIRLGSANQSGGYLPNGSKFTSCVMNNYGSGSGAVNGAICDMAGQEVSITTINTDTGGSQPHNNLPPYLAVYTWVRTA